VATSGNGAAIYGVWVAIVCLCSKQSTPREGWLTDDGTELGVPLTTRDIELTTGIKEKTIKEALPRFVEVGWVQVIDNTEDGTSLPRGDTSLPQSGPFIEGNRRNRIEDKDAGNFYLTFKDRKLRGWLLESFNRFWELWHCPKYGTDKSKAADSWYDLPWPEGNKRTLENIIYEQKIRHGAKAFVEEREEIIAKGKTPIYAQGWLSERRFESYEDTLDEADLRAWAEKQIGKQP